MIRHLIVARTVNGFGLKMIPITNIMNFMARSVRINKLYFLCDNFDGELIYQAICLDIVHVQ